MNEPTDRAEPQTGWECHDGTPDEDHDWRISVDTIGDYGVVNGTAREYSMVCRACGKEREATEREISDAWSEVFDY
jgi:hypothetical protein